MKHKIAALLASAGIAVALAAPGNAGVMQVCEYRMVTVSNESGYRYVWVYVCGDVWVNDGEVSA